MCCKNRHEHIIKRRNDFVRVEVPHPAGPRIGKAQFDGSARRESLGYWRENGDAVDALIHADTIFEGTPGQEVELRVPNGRVCAIGIRRTVAAKNGHIVGKPKTVKMLTRAAEGKFEKSIHARMPLILLDNKVYIFSERDIVSSEVPINRELF